MANALKKVLFRADARPSIGIGDLMSLIRLAEYFTKASWECHFMIRAYDAGLRLIKKYELDRVAILPADISRAEETVRLNRYARQNQVNLIFLEITECLLTEYSGLAPEIPKACVNFDGCLLEDMALVVDWDAAANTIQTPANSPSTRFLLGPEYVILPINYFEDERISNRTYQQMPRQLLIAMGGADEFDFTGKIAREILTRNMTLRVTIVTGAGYGFQTDLEAAVAPYEDRVILKHNIASLLDEYLMADVAVAAGGLIASELVASRTRAVIMATYDHQIARCQYFEAQGWIRYLGYRVQGERLSDLPRLIRETPIPSTKTVFTPHKIVEAADAIITG